MSFPAKGAPYSYDSNGNPIGFSGINGDILGRSAIDAPLPGRTLALMDGTDGTLALVSSNPGESVGFDTSNGIPMIKCTLSTTAGSVFIASYTLTTPVYAGGFNSIQMPQLFADMSQSELAQVQVWLFTATGSFQVRAQLIYTSMEPNRLYCQSFSRDTNWSTSQPSSLDIDGITKIEFVVTAGNSSVAKAPFYFGPMTIDKKRKKGRILIYSDGNYISQNQYFLPLLDNYGLKLNLAVVVPTVVPGSGATTTLMNEAQLNAAYLNGHCVLVHTFSSVAATAQAGWANVTGYPNNVSPPDNGYLSLLTEFQNGNNYLSSRGWVTGIGHRVNGYQEAFTPISPTTATSHARQLDISQAMTDGGIKTVRVGSSYAPSGTGVGMTFPVAHPQKNWRRFFGGIQITNTNTAQDVMAVIDAAAQRGEVATILLHRADLDSVTPASLEMNLSQIIIWVEYLAAMVASGQIICDTVDNTYNALK